MSKRHGPREQKRLAKKKSKRQARRRELAVLNSPDPTIRLKGAERWPVVVCLIPENLWVIGIGNLVIARRTPDGQFACATFLVDVFSLGVKDAMWQVVGAGQFSALCEELDAVAPLEETTPERFAKLVYRAADYGQSLGFAPHRDFGHAQRLLAGIDPSRCSEEFEFGREGRPFYIRGPGESMDEARVIAARVQALGGDFALPHAAAEAFLSSSDSAEARGERQG